MQNIINQRLSAIETLPYQFCLKQVIHADADIIFQCLKEASTWSKWAFPIKSVIWTSPPPFGVGTTRKVNLIAGLEAEEIFIAWEEGRRMAFTFTDSNQNLVDIFIEDYQLIALNDNITELTWSVYMKPKGLGHVSLFFFQPFLRLGMRYLAKQFRNFIDAYSDTKMSQ